MTEMDTRQKYAESYFPRQVTESSRRQVAWGALFLFSGVVMTCAGPEAPSKMGGRSLMCSPVSRTKDVHTHTCSQSPSPRLETLTPTALSSTLKRDRPPEPRARCPPLPASHSAPRAAPAGGSSAASAAAPRQCPRPGHPGILHLIPRREGSRAPPHCPLATKPTWRGGLEHEAWAALT